MAVSAAVEEGARGEEALERLRLVDPPLYVSPSQELSGEARAAACHLFSALVPWFPKAPPVDRLLADEGFDAEQIWSQIDLLARPVLTLLRRELSRLERDGSLGNDEVILPEGRGAAAAEADKGREEGEEQEEEDYDEDGGEEDGEEDDEGFKEDEEADDAEEDDEDDDGEGEEGGVEDRFLKIRELEEYLKEDEAREYRMPEKTKRRRKQDGEEDEEDEGEVEDDDNDEEDDELELGDFDDGGNEETDLAENARYEDFFGGQKRTGLEKGARQKKGFSNKAEILDHTEDMEMDDKHNDDKDVKSQDKKVLSTHEKELLKMRAEIEQMEEANLEPKFWTMQGEVTAAKRPKNSALEVYLDFEHNMRLAPVVTVEVTASLEDLIRKRIVEGHFNDVQKAPALPFKAPKEQKELDETKSKKGLAELYEEEYAQKTGLATAPLSVSDEQKREASILFKKLCSKLDALSHFHFAPKPVIEDMSIQANIPALAMEEVAPVAVSDAAMLAPEEIFEGKGNIKEEAELTQAERKRRRANKKRKYKAEMSKKEAKRARENVVLPRHNGKQDA